MNWKALLWFVLLGIFISCSKPEEVVSSTWSETQPKLVEYYETVDGQKVKVGEKRYYKDGKTEYEGGYDAQGLRDGEWKYFYENGTLWSIGTFEHGIKTGKKMVYWPNGNLRYRGEFLNDKAAGVWTFYNMDGTEQETRDINAPVDK